jgi:alkylation response protein AidB-like acyl-CoA dehydrogenase
VSLPGVTLSSDQAELVGLVTAVVAHQRPNGQCDELGRLGAARKALVDAGLWTLAVPEAAGGGGAKLPVYLAALTQLGRSWPALAWGIAQAHAAAQVLAGSDQATHVLGEVLCGAVSICVADTGADHVLVTERADGRLVGSVGRVDPCGDTAYLLLMGDAGGWLVSPATVRLTGPLRRTGLAGARTSHAYVDAQIGTSAWQLTAPSAPEALAQLRIAGAAIAAGLAYEAAWLSADYARQRVQFGALLTALPTVRQSLLRQTSAAALAFSAALGTDPHDAAGAASCLEDNCERAVSTAAAAIQTLGGYGYLAEYGVERILRDAVSLRAATAPAAGTRAAAAVRFGPSAT